MAEEDIVNEQGELFETDEVSVIQDGDDLDASSSVLRTVHLNVQGCTIYR